MSADIEAEGRDKACCASCGIAEVDDIKLKDCSACHLARYCSIKRQRDHRPQHKKECKKRAAELRDEILFKQPESNHLGDCPICCLPLSNDPKNSAMMGCCCKVICEGCSNANLIREVKEKLDHNCPFCRHPAPESEEEYERNLMKRVEANDPTAMRQLGGIRRNEGDYDVAVEYWTKAAELGNADAHYDLSLLFEKGEGVVKDKKRKVHHLEQAAIAGHAFARHNLGCEEFRNGKYERSMKHFIIAANLGYDKSLESLKKSYRRGLVSKKDLAAALRGYQAAEDATKSPQRETAFAAGQEAEAANRSN
eukprot:CAMPEP_0113409090 /NCGR_PEP_ID=MMETSP0013_2-20120614/20959_1 /TAXON_ID=2843 ORGANISM="Skeletonema costatum, Strain 1716" /NCGR_SAMPLE_ID=MMETSP0013_2 /ASSEMBLY_ACC=CAM_ASM_000158 /LENGTH=308 /DNA_ID=CAMNT_0000295179 /DNA_START=19 /DNA_END=945 /DNA_ORIENTATION=+ /assembly_acc=CAM_ASM_000158